jgi:hypothetical protein
MSEAMRFEVDEKAAVLVEVDEDTFGVRRASRDSDEVIRAGTRLQDALGVIRPTAQAVVDALSGLDTDEQQVTFGVILSGEIGAMIAKTTATAHFTVTLSWKGRS